MRSLFFLLASNSPYWYRSEKYFFLHSKSGQKLQFKKVWSVRWRSHRKGWGELFERKSKEHAVREQFLQHINFFKNVLDSKYSNPKSLFFKENTLPSPRKISGEGGGGGGGYELKRVSDFCQI